jgi:exonuclease SbcC
MIDYIEIENFQSHKKSRLDFDSGLNVIIGKTDVGKSAIQRAVRKCLENKPKGKKFQSYWGGDTSIEIGCEAGKVKQIINNKNIYEIYRPGEETETENDGRNVPDAVKDIFYFSDLNFQFQRDQPFLLSKTGGDAAEYFNQLVDIDIIDKSMSIAAKELKQVKREKEFNENELSDTELKLKEYAWVCDADNDLSIILQKSEVVESITKEYDGICLFIEEYNELKKMKSKINYSIMNNDLRKIKKCFGSVEKIKIELDGLVELIDKITIEEKIIKKRKNDLSYVEKEIKKIMPEVCPLCNQKIKKK